MESFIKVTKMNLISFSAGLFILMHTNQLTNSSNSSISGEEFDDFGLTTVEIIEKYGYPAETHQTVTEDGYILVLHRIPHGRNYTEPGFPILLTHALSMDSSVFLLNGEKSLGLYLADAGFDVWLVNFRGNHYTRSHKYLSIEDSKFWDFSLYELGVYDLPAVIDYVCNHTNNDGVLFLGFSMGTTVFFVMASERPEYQEKIRGAALLAPVGTAKYSTAVARLLYIPLMKTIQLLTKPHSFGDGFQDSALLQQVLKFACDLSIFKLKLCTYPIFAVGGTDPKGFDEKTVHNLVSHVSSTSVKLLEQFAQLLVSSKFRKFDYGIEKNLAIYKQPTPPEYHLESTTIPISLFIGLNDIFANPENVLETLKGVRSVKSVYVVPQPSFTHVDFISGKDVDKILNPEISRRLNDFISDGNDVWK